LLILSFSFVDCVLLLTVRVVSVLELIDGKGIEIEGEESDDIDLEEVDDDELGDDDDIFGVDVAPLLFTAIFCSGFCG
jgi:hypothetical protein